ncbi:hypothetical protein [Sphingomonas crocodyli]|nr:hypothetical protein [Sphingomonas crocodyli]
MEEAEDCASAAVLSASPIALTDMIWIFTKCSLFAAAHAMNSAR